MGVRVRLWRRLSAEELMLLNCDVGEDLRVPWTAKRSNQSILKEISPRCSMEGMMLKLKLQYFGHLMHKSWLIRKDSDAGRGWGQEEKRTTEDEMAGWPHRFNRREFEWTPGVGDGQVGLVCCSSWGCKESDTTEWLNWTESSVYSNMLLSRHPCIVMVLSPAKLPIMLLISIVDNTEYLIDVSVLSILRIFSVRDTYQTYWCRC